MLKLSPKVSLEIEGGREDNDLLKEEEKVTSIADEGMDFVELTMIFFGDILEILLPLGILLIL